MSSSTVRPARPAADEPAVSPRDEAFQLTRQAQRWEVHGSVRGVGFRPFVRRLATELGLDGTLRTVDGVVRIDVAGPREALAELRRMLVAESPPHALVTDVVVATPDGIEPEPGSGFQMEAVAPPELSPPSVVWRTPDGGDPRAEGEQALAAAVAVVDPGGVVAVQGEDGYDLVCDATQPRAVAVLRGRGRDWARPLPVMVSDLEVARCLAMLTADEERLLLSSSCPIVLATATRSRPPLAAGVSPVGDRVGLCLPSTTLQRLLLDELDRPLVVADSGGAGNLGDGDGVLSALVDGVLGDVGSSAMTSSRRSIAWMVDGRPALLRRGRGDASVPLRLPAPARQPTLAVGAERAHTFALAKGDWAQMSEQAGDLTSPSALQAFEERLEHWSTLKDITPEVVVHDLHPGYLSTQFAARWPSERRVAVQHHHAHVASCAAEHEIDGTFVGVAFDGPGAGDDGTLWGGEVLVGDLRVYRRVGRFGVAPLPGGEVAVRRPARSALGHLLAWERLGGASVPPALVESFIRRMPEREVDTVRRMTRAGVNSPLTSSAAVLFDAVASMLGLRDDATFEGEAALVLESAAQGRREEELPWRVVNHGGLRVYDPTPTLSALLAGLRDGASVSALAAAFHATVASVTVALCVDAAREVRTDVVCLSGGLFVNRLLATSVADALRSAGFLVYGNERVPTGDAGVSYGQVAVAAARMTGQ